MVSKYSEYNKRYRKENKNKILKYSKKYREENKDKISKYSKKYREENMDKFRNYDKKRNKTEKRKSWSKKYNKKYSEENKDKIKNYKKSKREVIRIASKPLKKILISEKGYCNKCCSKENLELHHIKYINSIENVILLCKNCHVKEHNKLFDESRRLVYG